MRLPLVCAAGAILAGLAGPGRAQDGKLPPVELVASTGPRTPEEERKGFHLPSGYEIQLVAAEPEIHKPMNLAFDDRGRLWVTTSLEYPFPAPEGTQGRDAVKVLDDFGEDGRARKVTTFADGLNIPIGLLPLSPRDALVHSIPAIRHVTDSDGDGKADRSDVVYQIYGFKDTHGMTNAFTWGFDGWIYACHGFTNTSQVRASDGSTITMQSGNTYRMRADGSHLDWWSHGQVNPFGIAFDPLGNMFTCDCHSRPIYQILRGAYYPSFGKPDDGLGFGPSMIDHDHGSTGIAGIVYYAADQFPASFRDTIVIGNVVTSRINHDRLERHGSTLKAIELPDFLTSEDPWFRPVDIKIGPDGALYVADFYNKIIGHYEVPLTHPGRDRERGRIWRIVYRGPDGKGKAVAPRADWTTATVAELVQDLNHPNLTVRMKATNQLVERGGQPAIDAMRGVLTSASPTPWPKMHALWVLHRRNALDESTLEKAAKDPEAGLRVHAMRALTERAELSPPLRALVLAGLNDGDAFVQRSAAEALGQHPTTANVRPLLDLRHVVPAEDTHLLHVVRMALRDQLIPANSWAELASVPLSEADARALADVAPGVPSAAAAEFLGQHLRRYPETGEAVLRYVHHIARYGGGDSANVLMEIVAKDRPDDLGLQAALLKAIQQGFQERGTPLGDPIRSWAGDLARKLIGSAKPEDVQAGIELAGSLKSEPLRQTLVGLATAAKGPENQRQAALLALVAIDPQRAIPILGQILGAATEPLGLREQVAGVLARTNRPEARAILIATLPTAPGRLQGAIAAGLSQSGPGAEALLDAVANGKASARLLQDRGVELRLVQSGIPKVRERLADLLQGLPPADRNVQTLMDRRRAGFAASQADPALGAKVFEKHCAICHQLDGRGSRIGPQLDGIGVRGVDRLLEDVLDPNRNVDQAFRTTNLALQNGQVVSGLLLREEGQVLVLADAQGKEVRIPKDSVEERNLVQLSPMPANLAEQIDEADFYHLLAYLLAQRPADGAGAK